MTLTATQYALWFAGFAAHALLAVVMLKGGSYRRWPSLFSLAIYEMGLTITLFSLSHHRPMYFYVFWVGAIIRTAFGLWLVSDVIKALPGIQYAPKSLALGFVSVAVALAIGSAWMASSGGTQTFHLTMMALTLARCMSVIWGVLTITLFVGIGFCGLGWTPTPLKMASSVLVLVLLSCADSYAMSIWPKYSTHIHDIFNLCTLGVRFSWSAIMRKEQICPARGSCLPTHTASRER